MPEQFQATGARSRFVVAKETDWGVIAGSPNWRHVRLIGGETIQDGVTQIRSQEIRADRMRQESTPGNQNPDGTLPFELSPVGWNWAWYHLLGGTVTTTGTGPYTHVLRGAISLPVGFTLEKRFEDISALGSNNKGYIPFYGNRMARAVVNFNINEIIGGSFDVLPKYMGPPSATPLCAVPPVIPTNKPYTSAQVTFQRGDVGTMGSPVTYGICESLQVVIDNGFFADRGFVVGSNVRANLIAGTRMTDLTGRFKFANSLFFDEAEAGTLMALKLTISNGVDSFALEFPRGKFHRTGAIPNVTGNEPLSVDGFFECLPYNRTGAITAASNATPIVITSNAHGLANGDTVSISGVLGNTAANGNFAIANVTANTFELVGSAGNGAYTSGGTWTALSGASAYDVKVTIVTSEADITI